MKYTSFLPGVPAVSGLGLGLWPLTGAMGPVDIEAARSTIAAAFELGITFFDASRNAPVSEELLGQMVAGSRRDRCVVATKAFPGESADGLRAAVEKSLTALRTDYIDLFQLQGWYPQMPIEKVVTDAMKLVEEGKIRHLGVCNFDAAILETACEGGTIATNALEHNLLQRSAEGEDFEACARRDVAVVAHSALAKGLLSGRYRAGHAFDTADERARFSDVRERLDGGQLDGLTSVAAASGHSLRELAIAWLLSRDAVAVTLVGAKSPQQVEENCLAVTSSLDDALMARLDDITS
ncbi:MAG: aldo/keto reductase [Myxococcota bacterium]